MRINVNRHKEEQNIIIRVYKNRAKPVLQIGNEFIVYSSGFNFKVFRELETALKFYNKEIFSNRMSTVETLYINFIEKIIGLQAESINISSKLKIIAQVLNSENNEIKEFIQYCYELAINIIRKIQIEIQEEELIEEEKANKYWESLEENFVEPYCDSEGMTYCGEDGRYHDVEDAWMYDGSR